MKKLLTFLLLTLSIQLFSDNYKVIQKKGVTLSQQELNKNNKEIEIAAKRDYNLILQGASIGTKSMLSRMMNQQFQASKNNNQMLKNYQKKIEKFSSDMIDYMLNNNKIEIEKIRYVKNDVVEVTLNIKIKMPDVAGSYKKIFELMTNEDFISKKELKNLSEDEIFDKITTKMFETVKKTLEQTQEYSSSKATIYLEKDNGKWGVAELEEKLENYRQMYKISK
ncbi:hypothetical protein J5A73_08595 [Leptotrichia sp. oral taxon 218]|jgi:hypothetical protein|uniref:hypothetical protein n=1 Tax=Leptotrichia sp. oral taxon 218 TaxID=712361 RepID=UPI001B8CD478|nr:hypothetical protein [Leptotrichia sp. oral taxon 218]QUB95059.1 hypothetical protein J5A73_08595 [Leptotrichia sp. oral taxon 218]